LVETAATISLAGVLLAAFVPTFSRHLRLSKVSEAVEQLEALHQGAARYYAGNREDGKHGAPGCLPESVGPLPTEPSAEAVVVDFDGQDTPGREVWQALGLHGEQRLRYSYTVSIAQPGCGPRSSASSPAITFRAIGDLDGDGVFSTLERHTNISGDLRTLVPTGPLHIRDRTE
jgi:hypothetical protein